jgi:hypothetical protein
LGGTYGVKKALELSGDGVAKEIVFRAVALADRAVAESELGAKGPKRYAFVAQLGESLEGSVKDFLILNDFGPSALSHAPLSFGRCFTHDSRRKTRYLLKPNIS